MSQEPDPTRRNALLAMAGLPFLARGSLASTGQAVTIGQPAPPVRGPKSFLRGQEILDRGPALLPIAASRRAKHGVSLSAAGLPLIYATYQDLMLPVYGVRSVRIDQVSPQAPAFAAEVLSQYLGYGGPPQYLRITGTVLVIPEESWPRSESPRAWVLGGGELPDGFLITELRATGQEVWADFQLLGNWMIDWTKDLCLPLVMGSTPESMLAWEAEDRVLKSICWIAESHEPDVELWERPDAKTLNNPSWTPWKPVPGGG